MSLYYAKIAWTLKDDEDFIDKKYSREHHWHFDGGVTVPATASHHIVPLPFSNPDNVDPEQAFIASLSSCHMLFFLDLASRKKYIVEEYIDNAEGVLEKVSHGKIAMTTVTLKPKITFSDDNQPTQEDIDTLHHKAHELCFIANSVKTEIIIET
ncbi:MAG: OsmC family peroxiredoxin [Kordiimonadaceae bacterium]|mgnify:FL=1|jgi:organic hydroperoxide reductase OsmC/OhrA|nr:OsmC family peroxiredoxin [Kordiimonadaceae bacterium]MBT6033227.1 OsmC family peroxiredoxin [Kordiimonadaceae bacterium]